MIDGPIMEKFISVRRGSVRLPLKLFEHLLLPEPDQQNRLQILQTSRNAIIRASFKDGGGSATALNIGSKLWLSSQDQQDT